MRGERRERGGWDKKREKGKVETKVRKLSVNGMKEEVKHGKMEEDGEREINGGRGREYIGEGCLERGGYQCEGKKEREEGEGGEREIDGGERRD